jgi:hypothetical protein
MKETPVPALEKLPPRTPNIALHSSNHPTAVSAAFAWRS